MARIHIDQCLGKRLAALLRQLGHDVAHSQDLGLKFAKDDEQLLVAAQNDRILISKNGDDFELLNYAWQRWSNAWGVETTHAGILILPGDWLYPDAAPEISAFVQDTAFVPNALFEWRTQWYQGRAPRP